MGSRVGVGVYLMIAKEIREVSLLIRMHAEESRIFNSKVCQFLVSVTEIRFEK